MSLRKLFFVVLFVLSGVHPCAGAQKDDVDLGRIVVSASRIAQHDYKVASHVTVIDRQDIEASTAQTLTQVLEEQVGINVYDNSTHKSTSVDIRGFGDTANQNILVLVNDRKVNSIDITGPDMLQIPLESIERIEVIRGAGSVLYGDNAVGGVVNIITKKGKGPLKGKVGVDYASYETLSEHAEVSGSHKKLSYYLQAKYFDTQGYRTNSDLLAKDFNARLGYELSDVVKVDLITSWHEDDNGLPGGLSQSELDTLGRRGSAAPNDFAATKDRSVQLSVDVTPNRDWGHVVVDLSYRNRDTFGLLTDFDFGTKRSIDSYGLTGKYVFDRRLFNRDFNFVTGIDFYTTDNLIIGSGSNSDDLTISKDELGIYLFAEYEMFPHLYVNGGTRHHEAAYTFDQRSGTPNYETQSPSENVSMVGAKYEYAQGSNVFFNVQQTFRFLATDEWYNSFSGLNTELNQQTGIQYEAGIKHNWDDKVLFHVTPYWMDLKDEIFFDPTAGFFGNNNNYDKTRRVGVELGQKVNVLKFLPSELLSQLDLYTTYTYQDPHFLEGPNDGKRIPMAPSHLATAGLDLELKDKYKVSLLGRYVGSRYAINDTLNATTPIKPYYTFDTKLTYHQGPCEFYFGINNIFDWQYFTYVSKSVSSTAKDYFPAPGRNYEAGFDLKF